MCGFFSLDMQHPTRSGNVLTSSEMKPLQEYDYVAHNITQEDMVR